MASTHKQDRADFTIEFPSTGNVKCTEIVEFEIDDEEELEAVGDVSSERPVGVKKKRGPIMIVATIVPGVPPQVDFNKPMNKNETGAITIQYKGGGKKGKRTQYQPALVSKVKPAGMNADGESQEEVTFLCLGKQDN